MKRVLSFCLSLVLCGTLMAQAETTDTCSICVKKSGKSFIISSITQDKVYVRKPGNGDNKWYVFVTSPILELSTNRDTVNTYYLCNGSQAGIVTCWSLKPQDKKPVDDKDMRHKMAPVVKRHWLAIESLNATTDINVKFEGTDSATALLNIRKFPGWSENSLKNIKIKFNENTERIFAPDGNDLKTEEINLDKDNKLTHLELIREGRKCNFLVKSVRFDGQNRTFTFQKKESSTAVENMDDLMFDGQIIVSLPDEEILEGNHEVIFDAIVLTDKGPQQISLKVPIYKESAKLFAFLYNNIKLILSIIGLLIAACIVFILYKKRAIIKTAADRLFGSKEIDKAAVEEISKELTNNGLTSDYITSDSVIALFEAINNKGEEKGHLEGERLLDEEVNNRLNAENELKEETKVLKEQNESIKEDKGKLEEKVDSLNKEIEKSTSEIQLLRDKNRELTEKNESLSKRVKDLSDNCKQLETIKKEQEQTIKDMDANPKIVTKDPNPDLVSKVESLNHELELIQISLNDSNGKLNVANNQIQEKKDLISDLEKSIEELTDQCNNWEKKYHKTNDKLASIEAVWQEKMDKVKEKAKEEKLKQKEKYEGTLKEKEDAIKLQITNHQAELDGQKQLFDSELKNQQEKYEQLTNQLKEQCQKDLETCKTLFQKKEVKLKDTISEMGKSVNIGRDRLINQVGEHINSAKTLIESLRINVNNASEHSPIVQSTVELMISDIDNMNKKFVNSHKEGWSKDETNIQTVTESLQQLFIRALRTKGWINHVGILFSYSRIPQLCELLEQKGITPSVLEQLYAQTSAMLGTVNMAMNIPAVLATNFSEDFYKYENGDIWIDKFFPQLSRSDFVGKVFDIVRVGYIIENKEEKPFVQF